MGEANQITQIEHTWGSSYGLSEISEGVGRTRDWTGGQRECWSMESRIGKRGIKHSIGRAMPLAQGRPKTNNYLIDPEYRSPGLRRGSVSEWSVTVFPL